MAKKKKSSKFVSSRPKTSPYTSSPVAVYFGVDRRRYYVQDTLLKTLENLPPRSDWTPDVVLQDVDPDTGHILIHFLHTGLYQTLDDTGEEHVGVDEMDVVINEFQKAARASDAATKYKSPGLQQLAEAEMERRGSEMSLRDAVRATREHSIAKFLNENTWLQDFVSQKVQSAFRLNPEVFSEGDFFEQITSHTLTKIVAQNVVKLYSERVLDLQKHSEAYETPSRFEACDHTSTTSERPSCKAGTCPEPVEEVGALGDSSTTEEPQILSDYEPSTLEAGTSKVTEPPSKESEDSEKAPTLPKIAHHAEDASEFEAPEFTSAHTLPVAVAPEDTSAVMVVSSDAGAENKQDEVGLSDWAFGTSSSKKRKKKKGANYFSDIPEPAATAEVEPEPERATEPPPSDLAPEAAPTVESLSAEIEGQIWSEQWGGPKKKKKKGKGKATYESPPLEAEAAPGSDLIVPDTIVEATTDAGSNARTTTTSEIDDCPWRIGHLFEGEGWKDCKPCQAYMRMMGSKLHAAGLSEVNGSDLAV